MTAVLLWLLMTVVFNAVVFVCYKYCFVPDHKTHAWIARKGTGEPM